MSDFEDLIQNIKDISGEASETIVSLTALITASVALGESAYPYIIKVIDAVSDMIQATIDGSEDIIERLEELKKEVEIKAAVLGYIATDQEEYLDAVHAMAEKQEEVENELTSSN